MRLSGLFLDYLWRKMGFVRRSVMIHEPHIMAIPVTDAEELYDIGCH